MYNFKLGDIYSFGKNILEFVGNKYKVHYLVFNSKNDKLQSEFIAVALDFGYFGISERFEDAVKMVFHQVSSLKKRLTDKNEFLYNLEGISLEDYWELYRKISYIHGDSEIIKIEKLEIQNKALEENERELIEEIFSHRITIDMLKKALESEPSTTTRIP